MKKTVKKAVVIGIMGAGEACEEDRTAALQLGEYIGERGWITLTGGRDAGVMDLASQGARNKGGLVLGVLPDATPHQVSPHVHIPILTGMGSARNNINVLTSNAVVALAHGPGAGTLSEVFLAVKAGKPLILLTRDQELASCVKKCGGNGVETAQTPSQVMSWLDRRVSIYLGDGTAWRFRVE